MPRRRPRCRFSGGRCARSWPPSGWCPGATTTRRSSRSSTRSPSRSCSRARPPTCAARSRPSSPPRRPTTWWSRSARAATASASSSWSSCRASATRARPATASGNCSPGGSGARRSTTTWSSARAAARSSTSRSRPGRRRPPARTSCATRSRPSCAAGRSGSTPPSSCAAARRKASAWRRLDPEAVGPRLIAALLALGTGRAENDTLNRLVVEAGLDWRAVACLRTYCGYAVQVGLATRPAALAALADHPEPARLLFARFAARFRLDVAQDDPAALRQRFVASLDAVQALREDLLLRALGDVVEATVRTNFYAPGPARDHIAIKIRAADLAHLPPPRPLYEIYVHAPTMEGIHLRAGKVARGGIRLSDRPEDFRTEILGLMKTQTVKNALIVPTGAKGGFVVKGKTAVVEAYQTLVRGLLDLTDNLVAGRVVHPRGLVIHDEEDAYLVVAADKGTATFSDVANLLAAEYGFWLGDAFASGGTHGYDHKALGITARGVWECVRTHFRELGVDADTAPLTVAGIGDMGGDVFGNGLLRSPHLRLRAAFNHVHVFLDPSPDAARSFAERERLFRAGKGWDAYDPALLSPGGAVLARAAKRVTLSPEARAMLGLGDATVSGERLVP